MSPRYPTNPEDSTLFTGSAGGAAASAATTPVDSFPSAEVTLLIALCNVFCAVPAEVPVAAVTEAV
ncbi:hypothetical protein A5764_13810 [Mycobacterium sp. 852002-51057_SCH5723018]|nr:hypothetical protein A5764_13810 [Mycobacterium sp. 852002-51057_SCH5723018]